MHTRCRHCAVPQGALQAPVCAAPTVLFVLPRHLSFFFNSTSSMTGARIGVRCHGATAGAMHEHLVPCQSLCMHVIRWGFVGVLLICVCHTHNVQAPCIANSGGGVYPPVGIVNAGRVAPS